jgi:hypothetical protein
MQLSQSTESSKITQIYSDHTSLFSVKIVIKDSINVSKNDKNNKYYNLKKATTE